MGDKGTLRRNAGCRGYTNQTKIYQMLLGRKCKTSLSLEGTEINLGWASSSRLKDLDDIETTESGGRTSKYYSGSFFLLLEKKIDIALGH